MSNSSLSLFLSFFLSPSIFFVSKGCAKTRKYMGTKCMMLLSGKFSYPSLLIDWFGFFLLSAWLDDSFCFFLVWYHTVGPGSAISSVYAACCACGGQRGWLLIWNTQQKWPMDLNSSVYSWSKNIFFYNHLGGFICLCLIQFDIELDVFNNFMNLSMVLSLNCENFQTLS